MTAWWNLDQPGSRILVADDDPAVLELVTLALRLEGFEVVAAHDGREAVELARRSDPDLVILDIMMPGVDGLSVCETLRTDPQLARIGIILLSARARADDRVAGLRAGADDYLVKPFHPDELIERVRCALRRGREMRSVSPLTGLPGNLQIHREIERRVDERTPTAVLHVDLDSFKAFNDRYGFLRGDEAICAVARMLSRIADDHDGSFLGHIGGDDFVVVAPLDGASLVCDRIVAEFETLATSLHDSEDVKAGSIAISGRNGKRRQPLLSVSIGGALHDPSRPADVRRLIETAAEMKEVAKRKPGSCWVLDRRGRGPTGRAAHSA